MRQKASWFTMFANSVPAYSMHKVTIDTHIQTSPMGLVKRDPYSGKDTTYVPIWYVMWILRAQGITSTWDGTNWRITLPPDKQIHADWGTPATGSAPGKIFVNDRLVQDALPFVTKDPASGRDTTYMPIWYVMHMTKYLYLASTWDGTLWHMSQFQGKYQLIFALQQAHAQSARVQNYPIVASATNPFDDVPPDDWEQVKTGIRNGWVQPDSPTHFGLRDPLTRSLVDAAYWNSVFLAYPPTDLSQLDYPGNDVTTWGQIIGLHRNLSQNPILTEDDVTRVISNIQDQQNGMRWDGAGLHVLYSGVNEYPLFHAQSPSLSADVPPNLQEALQWTYQTFDAMAFSYDPHTAGNPTNHNFALTLPTFSTSSPWRISLFTGADASISMDGGKTWRFLALLPWTGNGNTDSMTGAYASWLPAYGGMQTSPSTVMVRSPSKGMTVYFDEMINGSLYHLGSVELGSSQPNTPLVARAKTWEQLQQQPRLLP